MIFFGQRSFEQAVRDYAEHYHGERKPSGSEQPFHRSRERSRCRRWVSVHRDHSLAVRLEQIGVLLDDAVFGRLCLGVL